MKIAVLFGGTSAERDVSVASGGQVVKALREAGHQVVPVDTARGLITAEEEKDFLVAGVAPKPPDQNALSVLGSGASFLSKAADFQDADVIFLALHGGYGEDGTIQACLDLVGIPYTGSGHTASANAMDKEITKRLLRDAAIPTPQWMMAPAEAEEVEKRLAFPVVVKPNNQGSTIGLSVVETPGSLFAAVEKARHYGNEVLIEAFIPGRELTVGILKDRALAVGEIIPVHGGIFDYQSKYQKGGANEIFPASLEEKQTETIKELALRAHRTLKLDAYSRVDFKMDRRGSFWCLEINTLPGMTATSLLPKSAQAVGISFPELCEEICRQAIERQARLNVLRGG
jgi:D-alanine-D-alanine ligase